MCLRPRSFVRGSFQLEERFLLSDQLHRRTQSLNKTRIFMIKNHDKAVLQGLNGLRDVRIFYFASSDNNPPIQDVSDVAASSKHLPAARLITAVPWCKLLPNKNKVSSRAK